MTEETSRVDPELLREDAADLRDIADLVSDRCAETLREIAEDCEMMAETYDSASP